MGSGCPVVFKTTADCTSRCPRARAPQVVGIIGHEGMGGTMQRVYGFPVTSLLQTWIDLGPTLTRVELKPSAAALVRFCAGFPLITRHATHSFH
ncbi:hypothetical protein [Cryobacterium sp. PH31-L1]|uniref:hypothetical protein n=1 Tax=Cryobacterium sp. PH31-L1 TaxID=3046199 RepID=UPI0024BB81CC|nr:hypothetical protein [Cryobacterium sp. PH31-L1]MDJ0377108.1 hypothetical protein [Cryobacterium sp. PH31-L1]